MCLQLSAVPSAGFIHCSTKMHASRSLGRASRLTCPSATHQVRRRALARLSAAQQTSTSTSTVSTDAEQVPPGCSRYTVKLTKPMGLVLEQDTKTMAITIAEIKPDGSAARSGVMSVGDQLIATSGVTYDRVDDYGGAEVKNGQKIVRMLVLGEAFKTVSAAIGSHPGHIPVTLEFQKCEK